MGKVVMNASVSVDGFIAAENDDPGPLFEWLVSGDVSLDDSGVLKVSQASYDHIRPYWDQVGVTIAGRHVFASRTAGTGRLRAGSTTCHPDPSGTPTGWEAKTAFHFVNSIETAVTKAQELAGDRVVEVAAGDVGGQVLAAGLVDELRMDVGPVVFGAGKRYFGWVNDQQLLEDPDVVIQGDRVLHLRYQLRR